MQKEAHAKPLSHRVFVLTLLAKGALGVIQLATAAALSLGLTDQLPALAKSLIAAELAEDPNDFLAARMMSAISAFPPNDITFYSYYFAAHGMLHVGVVIALLIGAKWAYPSSILILGTFIVYQVFEWMAVGGVMLLILSAIDLAVIYMTFLEWKQRAAKHHPHSL